jgi:hypothetical protein
MSADLIPALARLPAGEIAVTSEQIARRRERDREVAGLAAAADRSETEAS